MSEGGAPRPIPASPLGPKTLGEIIEGTFRVYGTGFLGILLIAAVVQVPLALLDIWVFSVLESAIDDLFGYLNANSFLNPSIDSSMVAEEFRTVVIVGGIFLLTTVLTFIIMDGALIYAVSVEILEGPIAVLRAYSFAAGRFGAMLGVSMVAALGVLLMAITIVGIPFAIYFSVRWAFVIQVALLERRNPASSLARSSDLVRDNWWRAFGVLLLIGIALAIANRLAGIILDLIPCVGPMVVAVLSAPVLIIAQTLLYHDLRVRRDGPVGYNPKILASELHNPSGL